MVDAQAAIVGDIDILSLRVLAAVAETGSRSLKDMGTVMKAVMARLAGQSIDGKQVSDLVKSKLT